jgi:hypothetical protein
MRINDRKPIIVVQRVSVDIVSSVDANTNQLITHNSRHMDHRWVTRWLPKRRVEIDKSIWGVDLVTSECIAGNEMDTLACKFMIAGRKYGYRV